MKRINQLEFYFIIFGFIAMISSCSKEQSIPDPKWVLAWSDEFNYTGSPADSIWSYEIGNHNGFGNQELENYTNDTSNIQVRNGNLEITGRFDGTNITSGRIHTAGKKDFLYGRFEMRAKIPTGAGTWPAFWLLPYQSKWGGWPGSGEIDIMEHVGNTPSIIMQTIHCNSYRNSGLTQKVSSYSSAYHVYAANWLADKINLYVDDILVYSFPNRNPDPNVNTNYNLWPFDQKFFVILNVAFGGTLGGTVDYNIFTDANAMTSATMYVDYVRVYKQVK